MPTQFFQQYQIKTEAPPAVAVEIAAAAVPTYESTRLQPWSEPVRHKPRLHASLNPAYYADFFAPVDPLPRTIEAKWHFAWSEPVRQKRGLSARLQSTLAFYQGLPVIPNVTGVIAAVETNSDTIALFVGASSDPIPIDLTALHVSIKEVDASDASASIRETE